MIMKLLRTRALLTVASATSATFLFCSCSGNSNGGTDPKPEVAQLQIPTATAVTRTSIPEMLGTATTVPVGLTITPDTDELVLLDAMHGVYKLDPERRFQLVADNASLLRQSSNGWEFTDIAALGSDQFALTSLDDGFLLDLRDGSLRQHFCYVPGSFIIGSNQIAQLTNGVAFDPRTGRIIAQPVTYQMSNGSATRSDVGTFPITGGEGDDWHPIADPEFLADAIAVDRDGRLWLAKRSSLYHYDLTNDELIFVQSLKRFDVTNVTGMTFHNDDLMVIDMSSRELVCIPAALL